MGGFLKLLAKLLVLVLILVVAAVVIIPLVVDPNDFKDEITAEVKKATGRDLSIAGDIGLSVFPWLGLELNGLSLSNAKGFGKEPFAAVDHAQVRAKLLPLLRKELEVDTLRVQGLRLSLAKAKDGRTNWDDLAAAEPDAAPEKAPDARKEGPGLASLAIGGVEVSDARIVWDDRAGDQRYTVEGFSLATGAIEPGRPVTLSLKFDLDSAQPALKAKVALEGNLAMDDKAEQLSLKPLTLVIDQLQMEDGLNGAVKLEAQLDANLVAQLFRLDGLKLILDMKGGPVPDPGLAAELQVAAVADLAGQTLQLSGLQLSAGDLKLSGDLNGRKIQSDSPEFAGSLNLAELNLRNWMQSMGMEVPKTADPAVLKKLAMSTKLQAGPKKIALNNLALSLDETRMTGVVTVLHPDKPGIRFDLDVDAIDADRYLPPPEEGEAAAPAASAAGAEEESPLFPVETLRQLDLDGVLRIGSLVIQKLKAESTEIRIKAKGGRLRIDQKIGRFYQGSVNGGIGVDVTGKTPMLEVEEHISKINAEPLVRDVVGEDRFSGTGNLNLKINGRGETLSAIKRTLGGNLNFSFTDGAVKGFNLAQMIRETKAKFSGERTPAQAGPNQTDFSELGGSGVIANGILTNRDLLAKSPFLRLTGEGQVNIGADTLDYVATPVVVGTAKGQGGEGLEDLKGIPVPIRLKGALAKPDWSIDWKKVLLASQNAKVEEKKQELQKKIDEKQQELQKELEDKLQDKLKGLFR